MKVLRCVFIGHEYKTMVEPDLSVRDLDKEGPLDWVLFCIRCGSVRKVRVIYDPPTDGREEDHHNENT
jgi:hypothetical protein